MKQPPRWKFAVVVWLAIYPLVTAIFALFGEQIMAIQPLALRTLMLTLILVPLMAFVFIPLIQRVLKSWLNR
jgi:antibiotic biosynthesis monooxygenase (ABM) superfamily enzyme